MTFPQVLTIGLIVTFVISVTHGLELGNFEQDSPRNPCLAPKFTYYGKVLDLFCMGVKDGQISFPEGTGCLANPKKPDCDFGVNVTTLPQSINHVAWSISDPRTDTDSVAFYFSQEKTSTSSKLG